MDEDLEAMLSQMSHKFDQSFAGEEHTNKPDHQQPPQVNPENHHHTEQTSITPTKAQTINTDAQVLVNGIEILCQDTISHRPAHLDLKKNPQKQKKQDLLSNKRELQKSSTVQQIKQMVVADYEEEYYEEESNICDKPLTYQQNGNQVDDDLFSYQSLTQKFEVALKKAKHNQSVTLNQSQFTYRQEHYLRKKATDINLMLAEKQKQLAKICTAKPLINSRSQQLLINHKPIHTRFQAVINDKKKRIETQVAEKLARQAEEEQLELNYIKEHQEEIKRKLGNEIRSEEEYYNQQKQWAEAKNKKIQQLASKKEEQSKQANTFKPEINPKSHLLMKKTNDRVPIYEKAPVPKKPKVDSNCTFKPNLNKTTKK